MRTLALPFPFFSFLSFPSHFTTPLPLSAVWYYIVNEASNRSIDQIRCFMKIATSLSLSYTNKQTNKQVVDVSSLAFG